MSIKIIKINIDISGCDLEVMIRAFQALCPGSIPGVRIIFIIKRNILNKIIKTFENIT